MQNLNTENISSLSFSETQKKGLLCTLLLAKIILAEALLYCTFATGWSLNFTRRDQFTSKSREFCHSTFDCKKLPQIRSQSTYQFLKVNNHADVHPVRLLWFRFTLSLTNVSNWHNTQWWSKEFSKNMLFVLGGVL